MTAIMAQTEGTPRLRLRRLGIDTYREFVVFMNRDCAVCRSEGFQVRSRVRVSLGGRSLTATLNVVGDDILGMDEASLSEAAWTELGAAAGTYAEMSHPDPIASDSFLRKKIYGGRLSGPEISAIVADIAGHAYDDIRLAAFVTACAGDRLDLSETTQLTRAMVAAGERLTWPRATVADKHCVGGLPGNRTTMIVVPIIAAAGLLIPKTSSRAITSPAGTADAMEALTTVDLGIDRMRAVVEAEGGCIAWGGSVQLSPADDILIGVERPLDLDSEGQLVASVLSKKIAAGATHVVLDLPVGPTAKIRDQAAAIRLSARLRQVAEHFGLAVDLALTDGSQPVGRGIGPSLEARDVLAVLGNEATAPDDLRDRALALAGRLIDLARPTSGGAGRRLAGELLASGAALRKFEAICEAQGGRKHLATALQRRDVTADRDGLVTEIDNRKLAKAAKLAGAPAASVAGVDFHAPLGRRVARGDTLFTLHADTRSELDYAMAYVAGNADIVTLSER
jgi:thymidine phosphorylase